MQAIPSCFRTSRTRRRGEPRARRQAESRGPQPPRVDTRKCALLGIALVPITRLDPKFLFQAEAWNAHLVWVVLANAVLFALLARAAYSSFVFRRELELITREIVQVDLLDRSFVAPYAQLGLREASYWTVGSCIASLLALDLERVWPLLVVLAGTLLLATLALLQPAQIIRRRLKEAKREELVRIHAQIQRAKEAATDPGNSRGGAEAARLPGLLAYESRIEAVREWPFDAPTLARFGALVILAVGSWLGGAMVERLLGFALD